MDIYTARLIRQVKRGCTYRRLAEIYYHVDEDGHGNQGYGEDLCRDALYAIYPTLPGIWGLSFEFSDGLGTGFIEDNKSYLGDFFWWE